MLQSHANDDKFARYIASDIRSFEAEFYEYIRDEISKIIRTDGTWSVGAILHQDVAKSMLENILWWLFDGDPEKTLLDLEELNSPQTICGKVFKPGEPTYSCRDCAMDPTCVFCQQCFRNSEHQNHRYKMHTSGGGGCCDCGDVEAWHQHHACKFHSDSTDGGMETDQDSVSRLPEKIRERAPRFFEVVLSYISDFLTNERSTFNDLDETLRPSEKSDCYVTMLYNDELHTFDFVIDILKKAMKCDDAVGADFATIVDREGRSAVCIDDENTCEDVKKIVKSRPAPIFSFRTSDPLAALVIHVNIVAHQEMALLLLPWLSRIVQQSEGLRAIFCEVALKEFIIAIPPVVGTSGSGRLCVVEKFIRCDHELWKSARNLYLQLLMNSLLLDAETKKKFGVLFTRLYRVVQRGFLDGDHEHGHSVASLAVQLYTVPTVTRHLIIHEDVIGVLLRSLGRACFEEANINLDNWCTVTNLNTRIIKKAMGRAQYTFYDLRYILAILPDQWTPELKEKFIDGFKLFVHLLMAMQGMDAVTRKADRHIEHEPDWETGVNMIIRFQPIIHHLLQWFRTDIDLLYTALAICLQALTVINETATGSMVPGVTKYKEKSFQCIDYDITKRPVSTQYPVSRLFAAILVELGQAGVAWSDIENKEQCTMMMQNPLIKLTLVEYSLRCLSLSAQVDAGMWRRNGHALTSQLFYYKDYRCRLEGFERDIQLLQVCAANLDPNHFLALLLQKMKLNPEQPDLLEYRIGVLGDFFRLLINICGERFLPGVGNVSSDQKIRRQLIHILASESKPHSKISKLLPDAITEKSAWEDILHEVADFQEPTNINSSGKYLLKQSVFDEFCPFSYHYSTATEETKAHNEIIKRKKVLQTVFAPPKLPQFTKLFFGIPNILCCDIFVDLLSKFLLQLTTGSHELWSDRLVEKALYLIAMGIIENEQQIEMNPDSEFNFIKKAVAGCESSILFLLKQLQVQESLQIHRDTIQWLISKIEKLSNHHHSTSMSSSVDPEHMNPITQMKENDQVRNVRKRKAQERRDKLLSQMKMMQQSFLSRNPSLMTEPTTTMKMSQEPAHSSQDAESPVCTKLSWQEQALNEAEPCYTCILCQEETLATDGSIVMSALVQRSTVLTRGPRDELTMEQFSPLFVDLSFPNAIHSSTCSHTMHYDCFKQFRESVQTSERRRHHTRYSRKGFDIMKNEFLCPLCSRLSNTVLPVISHTFIARQRGILSNRNQSNSPGRMIDTGSDQSGVTLNENTPKLKEWLRAVEEILKPTQQEAQEFVVKFNVDVTDLDEAMDNVEADEASGYSETNRQTRVIVENPVFMTNIPAEQIVPQDPILIPDIPIDESSLNEPDLEEIITKFTKGSARPMSDASSLQEGQQAALEEFIKTVQVTGFNGDVSEMHRPLTSWLSVATTVISAEMISRLDGTKILAKSPIRLSAALSGVIRAAIAMLATSSEEQLSDVRDHARKYLSAVIGEDTVDRSQSALMNSNIFSVFVNAWLSCSILRKSKQMLNNRILKDNIEFDKNLIYLFTLAQIIQIFLLLNIDDLEAVTVQTKSTNAAEDMPMYQACKQVRESAGLPPLPSNISPEYLESVIEECLRPFIRCCALFLHHATEVPAPETSENMNEHTSLLDYLGLPKNLTELFDVGGKISLEPLIQKWCKNPELQKLVTSLPRHLSYPTVSQVPDLVPFPHDFSDLIGAAALFKCPKFASEDSLHPTMCLVCGLILCSQSYCCQQKLPGKEQSVGASTNHSRVCGANSGIFLRVREAAIVLLNGLYKGCFIHAPYLDKYGETDKGLRRGNPLYLNQPRLFELRKLWLSHGIAERVTHDMEAHHFGHILDWAHL